MVETGNGTVTPVVSNLRIDPALVDGYLPFAHFFPSFFIRMLYLLHSLVKYIYMPIYPRVLVYQDKQACEGSRLCGDAQAEQAVEERRPHEDLDALRSRR